jgi:uncharacterized protein YecE (DUF72 family)
MAPVMVGTAAWSIPAQHAHGFPAEGSHLERYSRRFPAVEINSSFYRPHRPSTYQRWASTVPAHFRFAVKVPKEITHLRRLADVDEPLERFLSEAGALGEKLGPLLVQLPPGFAFDERRVAAFLERLRGRTQGDVACEPRHRSWFTAEAERLLSEFRIARVAADPPWCPPRRSRRVAGVGLPPSARLAPDVPLALPAWIPERPRDAAFGHRRRRLVHLRQHGGRLGDARRAAAPACVGARATGPPSRVGSAE